MTMTSSDVRMALKPRLAIYCENHRHVFS